MIRCVADIIKSAGGCEAIAQARSLSASAVEKWRRNGIPDSHWSYFVENQIATPDELFAANELVRSGKALADA